MSHTLLLFDIDGTLLDTGGAGAAALLDAAETVLEVRRENLPPLDLAGATDGGVIRKLFADAGREVTDDKAAAFRECYLQLLEQRLLCSEFAGHLLSGVCALLDGLRGSNGFAMGLLTGNLRRGAQLKLDRFRIAHHFTDGGFGDDGVDRNDLGPVAVDRMQRATSRTFTPDQVIVIGDTPKDIACAHAMDARCLAVATGKFDRAALSPFAPWMLLDDLSDTSRVIEWLAA